MSADHSVLELDVLVDARILDRFLEVPLYGSTLRYFLFLAPWPPPEAKTREVRIRTKTRVFEEVPGAADCLSCLEYGVLGVGELRLNLVGRVYA